MTQAFKELGGRGAVSALSSRPKIVTLGGDHGLALPALRALKEIYGKPVTGYFNLMISCSKEV